MQDGKGKGRGIGEGTRKEGERKERSDVRKVVNLVGIEARKDGGRSKKGGGSDGGKQKKKERQAELEGDIQRSRERQRCR